MAEYIDREKPLSDIEKYHLSDGKFQHWVEMQPAADVEHVIRCKDCRHSEDFPFSNRETVYCNMHDTPMCENDYCSRGEKEKKTMKEFESVVTLQITSITQIDEASQDYRDIMDDFKATKEAIENNYKENLADADDVQVKVQLFVRDVEEKQ